MGISRIIKSRFKKNKEEDWVEKRRQTCKACPYNSKNVEKIPFDKRVIIYLSDFYSWICGKKKEDNLGNCTYCGCSIFYSSSEEFERCKLGKWDNIEKVK